MASGYTSTAALTDSEVKIIASARTTREHVGKASQLVDKVYLGESVGPTWNEITLSQLTAQAVTENQELNNPQKIEDTIFQITPTVVGIHTVITDRAKRILPKNVVSLFGTCAQQAIQLKKDEDVIAMYDGATTALCGAGTTWHSGYISSAVARILGNATEPGQEPIFTVVHPYQEKDIKDEIIAGVGTYPITDGLTADVYKGGNIPMVGGSYFFTDGNITIDSSSGDAKGATYAKRALVLCQGRAPWAYQLRNNKLGGGADEYLLYDEYAIGERSAGNWMFEQFSDATAPTS